MAISNFIQTVWSAQLIKHLEKESVFLGLTNRNYEADSQNARTVKIGRVSSDILVGDYTQNTDMADPQILNDETQDLILDQQKQFNFYVDDIDVAQSKPDIMGEAMRRAAIAIAAEIDQFVVNTMSNGLLPGNILPTPTNGLPAETSGYVNEYSDLVTKMRKANIPAGSSKWMTEGPELLESFEDYLMGNGTTTSELFSPSTAEQALIAGYAGKFKGVQLIMTNREPTEGNVFEAGTIAVIAGTNDAVTFAYQIQNVEAYRPEKRFGDAVKGLFVYGAKVVDPNQLFGMKVSTS